MKKDILVGLALAAVMLALAFVAKIAHAHGYIGSDMTLRVIAMNGLLIAYFGNLVPKKMAPSAVARKAMRFSGWAQVLSGLIYAGLWAFAPIPLAVTLGTGVVFGSVILTLAYCVWLDGRSRTA